MAADQAIPVTDANPYTKPRLNHLRYLGAILADGPSMYQSLFIALLPEETNSNWEEGRLWKSWCEENYDDVITNYRFFKSLKKVSDIIKDKYIPIFEKGDVTFFAHIVDKKVTRRHVKNASNVLREKRNAIAHDDGVGIDDIECYERFEFLKKNVVEKMFQDFSLLKIQWLNHLDQVRMGQLDAGRLEQTELRLKKKAVKAQSRAKKLHKHLLKCKIETDKIIRDLDDKDHSSHDDDDDSSDNDFPSLSSPLWTLNVQPLQTKPSQLLPQPQPIRPQQSSPTLLSLPTQLEPVLQPLLQPLEPHQLLPSTLLSPPTQPEPLWLPQRQLLEPQQSPPLTLLSPLSQPEPLQQPKPEALQPDESPPSTLRSPPTQPEPLLPPLHQPMELHQSPPLTLLSPTIQLDSLLLPKPQPLQPHQSPPLTLQLPQPERLELYPPPSSTLLSPPTQEEPLLPRLFQPLEPHQSPPSTLLSSPTQPEPLPSLQSQLLQPDRSPLLTLLSPTIQPEPLVSPQPQHIISPLPPPPPASVQSLLQPEPQQTQSPPQPPWTFPPLAGLKVDKNGDGNQGQTQAESDVLSISEARQAFFSDSPDASTDDPIFQHHLTFPLPLHLISAPPVFRSPNYLSRLLRGKWERAERFYIGVFFVAAEVDGRILLWSGAQRNPDNKPGRAYFLPNNIVFIAEVDSLDLRWQRIKAKGDVPPKTSDTAFAASGKLIYLFGGERGNWEPTNEIFSLSPCGQFKRLNPVGEVPTERFGHGGWSYEGKLFFWAGCGPKLENADFVEDKLIPGMFYNNQLIQFDPEINCFSRFPTNGRSPSPRASFALSRLKENVYIHGGGCNGTYLNDFHVLNMKSQSWSSLKFGLPAGIHSHTISPISATQLLLVGGKTTSGPSKEIFVFNVEDSNFAKVQVLPSYFYRDGEGLLDHRAIVVTKDKRATSLVCIGGFVDGNWTKLPNYIIKFDL